MCSIWGAKHVSIPPAPARATGVGASRRISSSLPARSAWPSSPPSTAANTSYHLAMVMAEAAPRARSGIPGSDDPLWYRDAILYELHVKAFYDSNDDGIGDFRGLIEKLDYIQDLGVTAIWLLPTYPSPQRDDGYDIADYLNIQPAYGSLEDFDAFVEAAHSRGLRVITELVMNHTSDQHPWFQSARTSPDSPFRDHYVWSDT